MAVVISIQSRHASRPQHVLCIAHDISLLSARANLLTQAGYVADFVLNRDAAIRRLSVRRYHLVIISAAFAHDEQIPIWARIRQLYPRLPILLMKPVHQTPDVFLLAVSEALRPFEPLPDRLPHTARPFPAGPNR